MVRVLVEIIVLVLGNYFCGLALRYKENLGIKSLSELYP